MVSNIVRTVLPYQAQINGTTTPKHSARTMADWGSPLPTRKLAPYEDVQFDAALQPRAHRMTGKVSFLAPINVRDITDSYRNVQGFQNPDSQCTNVGIDLSECHSCFLTCLTILVWTPPAPRPIPVTYLCKVCESPSLDRTRIYKYLGERIRHVGVVPDIEKLRQEQGIVVIQGNGRTLMSGLGDAHTHLTWNGSALGKLGENPVQTCPLF